MRQSSHPIIDWMAGATAKEIKGLVEASGVSKVYLRNEVATGRKRLSSEAARRMYDYTSEFTPGRVLTLEALLPPHKPAQDGIEWAPSGM